MLAARMAVTYLLRLDVRDVQGRYHHAAAHVHDANSRVRALHSSGKGIVLNSMSK